MLNITEPPLKLRILLDITRCFFNRNSFLCHFPLFSKHWAFCPSILFLILVHIEFTQCLPKFLCLVSFCK